MMSAPKMSDETMRSALSQQHAEDRAGLMLVDAAVSSGAA